MFCSAIARKILADQELIEEKKKAEKMKSLMFKLGKNLIDKELQNIYKLPDVEIYND